MPIKDSNAHNNMKINDSDYYNFHWKQKAGTLQKDSAMIEKIGLILNHIPSDVKAIIDIGCGDGAITNELAKESYKVTALDISKEALQHLTPDIKSFVANASQTPLRDNYADLVFTSEMLEHLPKITFNKAIPELKRLSKKYIFISVPNNEKLRKRFSKCYSCDHEFHLYKHFRSFTVSKLKKIFNEYKLIYSEICGVYEHPSFNFISFLRNKLGKSYFFVSSMTMICPNCGSEIKPLQNRLIWHQVVNFSLLFLQKILTFFLNKKAQPDWLLVLFEKK